MCDKIDAKEVLMCLNELGYQNINALQLKEFLKDLRKLIKYEDLRHQRHISSTYREDLTQKTENSTFIEPGRQSFIKTHYDQPTHSSKARDVHNREQKITVQITKPQLKHKHCKHVNDDVTIEEIRNKSEMCLKKDVCAKKSAKNVPSGSEGSLKPFEGGKNIIRSKEFIKTSNTKTNKSDPVALYHQYQSIWKRTSIPGTDSRTDLRWAIREKMLSGAKVDIPKTKPIAKTRECWK